ncbi:MAG TPA: hypothetical protein VK898_17505, partial [Chloroflexota bacterium]|nr:hypothetical protein [Chloroflexota bacterium]
RPAATDEPSQATTGGAGPSGGLAQGTTAGAMASEGAPPTTSPRGPGESEPAEATEAGKRPIVVRRVVCSYRLGWLPGDWLQTWRRLDRVFARANLKVKATLAPLEDLPKDTDILVVPPDLREAAREAAPPGTPILVTPASAAAGAFAELVSRLEAGTDFTAEKVDPADKDKPKIVSYRGHTLID